MNVEELKKAYRQKFFNEYTDRTNVAVINRTPHDLFREIWQDFIEMSEQQNKHTVAGFMVDGKFCSEADFRGKTINDFNHVKTVYYLKYH